MRKTKRKKEKLQSNLNFKMKIFNSFTSYCANFKSQYNSLWDWELTTALPVTIPLITNGGITKMMVFHYH